MADLHLMRAVDQPDGFNGERGDIEIFEVLKIRRLDDQQARAAISQDVLELRAP